MNICLRIMCLLNIVTRRSNTNVAKNSNCWKLASIDTS